MERQESIDNTCPVCHEVFGIFSIGVCDHPICFRCSVRMRALCDQMYCAICRTDLPKVYLLRERRLFKDLDKRRYLENRKLNICFQDEHVRQEMERVLEHKCRVCKDRPAEKSFTGLRDHMRKQHTLFFCDLCVDHVKIFTHERKTYTRQQLALHRRLGDKDNTSYKGHPLCRFCDERYMDNEELWRHLRKDHFYCHFCDADGSNDYYSDYDSLMNHFRQRHFLCEEGDCIVEQFTNAFRNKIDLKAHRAQCHNTSMSKSQARHARTLDLDFQLAPRSRPERGSYSRGRGRDREMVTQDDSGIDTRYKRQSQNRGPVPRSSRFNNFRPEDVNRAIQASLQTMQVEDMKKSEPKEELSSEEELVQNEENFPALGNNNSANSITMAPQPTGKKSPSEQPDASFAHRIAKAQGKSVQHSQMSSEMFPVLPDPDSPRADRKGAKNNKTLPVKRQDPPDGGYSHIIKHGNIIADGDFPELQSKKKTTTNTRSSVNQWTKQTHITNPITKYPKNTKTDQSVSHKIVPLSKKSKLEESKPTLTTLGKVLKDDSEFPSLGGLSSDAPLLGMQWVRQNKPITNGSKAPVVNNIDNTVKKQTVSLETMDTDKNFNDIKSNKKKKKEKKTSKFVESDRTEKSLDSIASFLLDAKVGTVSDEEETEPVQQIENKIKSIKFEDDNRSKKELTNETLDIEEKQLDKPPVADVEKTEIVVVESSDKKSKKGISDVFGTPKPMRDQVRNGPKFDVDDFPALTANSKSANHPPPGFNSAVKPPPGFISQKNRPPPGFNSQMGKAVQTTTPRSHQGQSVAEFIAPPVEYTKPNDFLNRNLKLIKDISASLSGIDGHFDQFKSFSGEFRRGQLLAVEYFEKCENLLGNEAFGNIFPELIALLPDIKKQQQLLAIYLERSKKSDDNVLRIGREPRTDVWKKSTNLQSCPTCHQVVVSDDYNDHVTRHSDDKDFPVLNSAWSQSTSRNAWIKAT